ncbi:hypothetical protein DWB77_04905 [Streptomyces hundungensis]|uniref:Uncharacterized protein n=1 Tax=Streptomyces hundungensis TaxID=1077946 RepID=A0A387HP70_9ACTN|nr:hypothetical protein DWB77_04905 [Streptomyces hundungensis]
MITHLVWTRKGPETARKGPRRAGRGRTRFSVARLPVPSFRMIFGPARLAPHIPGP